MNKWCCVLIVTWCFLKSTDCVVIQQDYPVIANGTPISISLLNYNVSDADGESIEYIYTLLPYTAASIDITNIPGDVFFIVLQAHSYLENVTLSYSNLLLPNNSVTGTNIGLWKTTSTSTATFYLSYLNNTVDTTLMVAVQAYGNKAPIPGGCNMELPIEISPFLVTNYTPDMVQVQFAPASAPLSVLAWLGIQPFRSCSLKPPPVEHVMYKLNLYERDFSPTLYFEALTSMMTVGRIRQRAHAVPLKEGSPPMRRSFAAYPGTGAAYVVVANTLSSSAVYVPSFSYGCDARVLENSCSVLTTTFSKLMCAMILFLGLFTGYAAHRFFKLETFLFVFLSSGLIAYILLKIFFNIEDPLTWAVGSGVLIAFVTVQIWCCLCSGNCPLASVFLATSTLGYLLAAIVFFVIVDYVDLFVSDTNYWLPYVTIMFFAVPLLLPLSEKANVLAAAVIGGFAVIVPIDYYLGSNIRYLFINTIRRATVPGFNFAIIDPPFQQNDIVLAIAWVCLAVSGYICQLILIKNRPPFPPPSNYFSRWRRATGLTETTPLLTPAR